MAISPARQNALRKLAELKRQVAEIETWLRLYESFENDSERSINNEITSELEGIEFSAPKSVPSEIIPAVRKILLSAQRAMTRSQLVEALENIGFKFTAKDRSNYIGTVLWRANDKFINLPSHGYWPRDVRYDAAGYDPDDHNSPEAISHTLDLERSGER